MMAVGWRAAFVLTGLLGLGWAAVWWWLYHLPKDHRRLSAAERDLSIQDQPA